MDSCPPPPGRITVTVASRLSHAPYLRICRICIQSCALPPPLQTLAETLEVPAIPVPCVFREKGVKNPCRVLMWRTGHEPYLSVFLLLQCIVHDYVWGGTPRYNCTHGQRQEMERWVQVEYQDNYVKCNAGYRKRKGGECKHERAAVRAFNA